MKDNDRIEPTTVWDRIFRDEGTVFDEPHEDMPRLLAQLAQPGTPDALRVLDLGCGSGRHVVHLAQHGHSAFGLDGSAHGLALTTQALARLGLHADLRQQDLFADLPYADSYFDAVLAIQVIHHARVAAIARLAGEITRVLRPGGLLFVTVPQLRNQGTRFEHIEPGTLVPLDGREAGLPHHYFTPDELGALFGGIVVVDLHLDRDHHYCLTARKAIAQTTYP